jgi:myo-inositol-1(or 4)-monophosphatase
MKIYQFAAELINEAGQFIKQRMTESYHIDSKSNRNDLVTDVDRETETLIFERIASEFPEHKIIGEEGHGTDIEDMSGVTWIVDPIDGTLNFVHQQENFSISMGIFIDGEPYAGLVLDVMNGDLYHARYGEGAFKNNTLLPDIENSELRSSIISTNANWLVKEGIKEPFVQIVKDARSVRSYGSAALEITNVATGLTSAALFYRLHPWDFAGGMIIVNELGGLTTTLLGDDVRMLATNSIVTGNPNIHQELIQYFNNDDEFVRNHAKFHGLD